MSGGRGGLGSGVRGRVGRGGASLERWLLAGLLVAGCSVRASSPPIPGVTIGAPCLEGRCAEGSICRHVAPGSGQQGTCQLDVGRCRSDWDCARASAQRCLRLGHALGVCQDAGL